jgi:hypothetical protein
MTPQLTTSQLTALAAAINASTDPNIINWRSPSVGNDGGIAAYYNEINSPVVKAWRASVDRAALFDSMNLTQYDGLTAGKRDSWALMLEQAPLDFKRNKIRSAVTDIWNAGTATSILTDCTRDATRAEALFGGSDATDGSVTAKKLSNEGALTSNEVALALRG